MEYPSLKMLLRYHCMKSVQIWSFFWSVFSCILTEYVDLLHKSPYSVKIQENTDQKKLRIWTLYGVHLCIQSEYKKIWTRKNSAYGHFSRSVILLDNASSLHYPCLI